MACSLLKLTELDSAEGSYNISGYNITRLALANSARGYRLSQKVYKNTLRNAFFEPNKQNMYLFDSVISVSRELSLKWSREIRDSDTLENNIELIKEDHLNNLSAGDVSILGLLTIGGQGLATASNDDYLAYLDGTRPAEKVKSRNDSFEYESKNDEQFKWMSRVIKQDQIADVDSLSKNDQQNGIQNNSKHWVPIIKGKGEAYYSPVTEYIDWSRESVQALQNDPDARWQGYEYFFEEGLFISRGGTGNPVIRFAPPGVMAVFNRLKGSEPPVPRPS